MINIKNYGFGIAIIFASAITLGEILGGYVCITDICTVSIPDVILYRYAMGTLIMIEIMTVILMIFYRIVADN